MNAVGILNCELVITADNEFIYFPVIQEPECEELRNYEITEHEFRVPKPKIRTYRDIIDIPDELREYLPTSYDIIGQIAIFKLDDEILPYRTQLGEAMLEAHKNLRTIALDHGVKGEFRIRDIEIIAGSRKTETIHKEYGVRFAVDLAEVYFSPRLSGERYRVAQLVRDGESIIDMFTGVGPFSIMIARYARPERIYAIDKNPKAFEYLKKNIELNSINTIDPIYGDARTEVPKVIQDKLTDMVDRIIMILPHAASKFLQEALGAVKVGGVIHYHEILDNRRICSRVDEILELIKKSGFNAEVLTKQIIGTYSPSEVHVCLDLQITSKTF